MERKTQDAIRRHQLDHPVAATVVEVCGNTGYNWFDLPESKPFQTETSQEEKQTQKGTKP